MKFTLLLFELSPKHKHSNLQHLKWILITWQCTQKWLI